MDTTVETDEHSSAAPSPQQLADAAATATALAEQWPAGAERLRASVIRPLAAAAGDLAGRPASSVDLVDLTRSVTRLTASAQVPAQVIEAAAALQDLALRVARSESDEAATSLLAELTELQAGARPGIRVAHNGPYLVTGADNLRTYLGEPVGTRPQMALCRCGASESKPFCDGSHAHTGFTGDKDPNRVPDRRDTYEGGTVTVYDNRGLCQHSGFCTDRLSTVFHSGSEPFVTPSGGRMDQIVAAVRACPSGALSYGVDGREAREQVDQTQRPAQIEISKDGPYRITGGIALTGDQGEEIQRPQGASHEHYALCRCGQSQNKPFCSGMHWYVNFSDPPLPEDPTIFQWAGGYPALLRLTKTFYSRYVPEDPLLSPLFANMSPDHPERVASWLSEVFGGPDFYSGHYGGYSRMIGEHIGKCLTEEQRARWSQLMVQAANDVMLPNDAEFRAAFVSYIEWGTRLAVENSQTESKPPMNMPMPHWWWVCDATPGARVSALAEPEEDPAVLPAEGEPVSYAKHVKTLFRRTDRNSMKFVFDLWSYKDVSQHADHILARLSNGTMPCDGPWPQEKLNCFSQWIEAGKPE
ncbi:CDGSH iron-sulfur domain-containing protein [Actinocrispum wychmicini]|uniref:Truncated hemoglobin YjbI n=1 Tax=Actinocrispum wychmicini TaxID=1213861 RepID=A0A4R2J9F3_9PSEU|nr:CDGSH iron-sulfur domain-containing protein [Actinocrispum wychmicini]TCO54867.1 truncated hemoglobin YjbI [Actinocrispum wychmicini]